MNNLYTQMMIVIFLIGSLYAQMSDEFVTESPYFENSQQTLLSLSQTISYRYVELRSGFATINLEGPAVTGEDDVEGDDENGFSIEVEGYYDFWDFLYVGMSYDFSRYDTTFNVQHLRAFVGAYLSLFHTENFRLDIHGKVGVEYVRTRGLEAFEDGVGNGEDGDDWGVSVGFGLRASYHNWEFYIDSEYLSFGDGDGPGYGFGLVYHVSDHFSLIADWEGFWVEDAGFNIDLATQKYTFGFRYQF
ncbi:hypothetical protein [Candidatus Uabimicrobium amorphum]|uniref:Outer membrane protein beta-barrel domain-containing protein n=1 Tax=Uabimicrobium amorphum TaxID=2596890 RepID=A0A5S9F7P7_UABAM|nr:hypothetical protein [Candidatus Uabimicrobium amorphum]BBM87462.1 hypothetical protein UABAM_05871 [Candidatus Uabimicrobium amorphum]